MPSSKTSASARDPRVDDYIAQAAPFAREPLEHVRTAMHAALPDVTEAIKWSHPFFLLDGRPFANMAAFKAHCSLGFWRGGRAIAEEAAGQREPAMGQFGRIESLADLPEAAALRTLIVEARKAWTEALETKAGAPPPPKPRREAPAVPEGKVPAAKVIVGPAPVLTPSASWVMPPKLATISPLSASTVMLPGRLAWSGGQDWYLLGGTRVSATMPLP